MKRIVLILAALAALSAPAPAHAQGGACFADYKAQRTSARGLELHYGVIQLGPRACRDRAAAERQVARRIAAEGWQLLRVMATFDESGLNGRRANAGAYFLRY